MPHHLVGRASSNARRTVAIRPRSQASRLIALRCSSLRNTGMITASLIASHVCTTSAKSATSRLIRARTVASTSSVGISRNQSAASVCHTSGCPLTWQPWSTNHSAAR